MALMAAMDSLYYSSAIDTDTDTDTDFWSAAMDSLDRETDLSGDTDGEGWEKFSFSNSDGDNSDGETSDHDVRYNSTGETKYAQNMGKKGDDLPTWKSLQLARNSSLHTLGNTDSAGEAKDAQEIYKKGDNLPTSQKVSARNPSLHTLENTVEGRRKYIEECVPLYRAALEGDWKSAKKIIGKDPAIIRASITKGWQTVLHVAVVASQVHFVKKLLKMLNKEDLELQDLKGNTAFIFAVMAGSLPMINAMMQMNPKLALIRGDQGMTTLYVAALFGKAEVAQYLYPKLIKKVDQGERLAIFFTCIATDLYEVALRLLQDYPESALGRDDNNETGLHLLSKKPPAALAIRSPGKKGCCFLSCCRMGNSKRTPALELVRDIWKIVIWHGNDIINEIIRTPSHVLLTAAKYGHFEFVAELIGSYPDMIWEKDDRNRSVFHISVIYRQEKIFRLLYKMGAYKDVIFSFKDGEGNTILHLAAKLAPGIPPQRELDFSWFEEVMNAVPPFYMHMRNSEGKTPIDIFVEEHDAMISKKEEHMILQNGQSTCNKACAIVAELTAMSVVAIESLA